MKFLKFAAAGVLVAGLTTAGTAQTTLTQVWKVEADSVDYMTSASHGVRGLAFNPTVGGSVLAASTDGGVTAIRRLDPSTGALKTPSTVPNATYTATGTSRAINKVVVDDAGVIYACSLTTANASNVFNIYRHANETSEATVAFTLTGPTVRLGDDMAITGTGVNTKILVASSAPHVSLFTTADGLNFTRTALTLSPAFTNTAAAHIDWDPTTANRFWFRNASGVPARAYDISGSTATQDATATMPDNTAAPAYAPFDVENWNGKKYLFLGIGASAATTTGKTANVYDLSDLSLDYLMPNTARLGSAAANGNAAGDVDVDTATQRVFVLYTNNSITAFHLHVSGVDEWSLF